LALQVSADLLPRYREGAWLVDLASVRDLAGVAEAVAGVFRLTSHGGLSLEDTLIEMLAQKHLLLVLDNCEHLLGPVARLVTRIEQTCPGVVVLATSREGIAIDGEQIIALPPLETGEPDDDLERLMNTDAVSLFVERARRAKADFALTPNNARAVVEVCKRLDGVPLAIELAAARVIALSPAELLQRLDRRFQVLSGGRRGAVERHATLRAAIDWSYELLGPAEQRLLARMSVFSGGCTLEAIEDVCGWDPIEPEVIVDLVTGLVVRSLVVAEDRGIGTRYRMLETIRQYAEERLTESDETEMVLSRHADHYAELSAQAAKHFYGPDQLFWGRQIHLELDNIRSALAYAMDSGDAGIAVRLVANHPHIGSYAAAGEILYLPATGVLALPGVAAESGYPRVLIAEAWNAFVNGYHEFDDLCEQALKAERNLPEPLRGTGIEIDVYAMRAYAALSAGAYADAESAYDRAAALTKANGYPGLAAIYLANGVNSVLLGGGSIDHAVAKAEESLALARQSHMPAAIVMSLNSLALSLVEEDPGRAKALLQESIRLGGRPGEEIATGLLTACLVAGRLRDWALTLALTARTMYLYRWNMGPLQTAPCLALTARALAEDKPELAGLLRGAAYAAFRRASPASTDTDRADDQVPPADNFVLDALRETGDLVTAALGDERRRELRATGAAMSMDEAVSAAVANIAHIPLADPSSAA
jgi:predicted ATPase